MNRRTFLVSLAATACLGTAAEAKDYADDVLRQLRRNGYDVVSVSRTMLGRTRIRATKSGGEREIILNAATGEILRDVWIAGGSGGGLWDGDDDGDDGDDDRDGGDDDRDSGDDDRDDDDGGNSGSRGGNSGSGGGGDDDDGDDD